MPELPEVQTVVTTLLPHVLHRTINAVHVHRQDIISPTNTNLPALLTNRTIHSLSRAGKRIVFTLDDQTRFYIHLGMTGRLTLNTPTDPLPPHTHLVLTLTPASSVHRSPFSVQRSPTALRFTDPRRFGGLFLLHPNEPDHGTMGPDPLTITPDQLFLRLHKSQRPIKSALMDQRTLAGLGNIYVDESLFSARLHPLTPCHRLTESQVRSLTTAIQQVLTKAITHRGSTLRDYRDANNEQGNFQSLHQVYAREDKPCPACHSPIQRFLLSNRSTHFCPTCQPKVKPRPARKRPPRK